MTEKVEFLREYRSKMDCACESLAIKLMELGMGEDEKADDELVNVAARKLGTLFDMLKAAGLSEGILKAVMAE